MRFSRFLLSCPFILVSLFIVNCSDPGKDPYLRGEAALTGKQYDSAFVNFQAAVKYPKSKYFEDATKKLNLLIASRSYADSMLSVSITLCNSKALDSSNSILEQLAIKLPDHIQVIKSEKEATDKYITLAVSLGDGFTETGHYKQAENAYNRIASVAPNDDRFKKRIEYLNQQRAYKPGAIYLGMCEKGFCIIDKNNFLHYSTSAPQTDPSNQMNYRISADVFGVQQYFSFPYQQFDAIKSRYQEDRQPFDFTWKWILSDKDGKYYIQVKLCAYAIEEMHNNGGFVGCKFYRYSDGWFVQNVPQSKFSTLSTMRKEIIGE